MAEADCRSCTLFKRFNLCGVPGPKRIYEERDNRFFDLNLNIYAPDIARSAIIRELAIRSMFLTLIVMIHPVSAIILQSMW